MTMVLGFAWVGALAAAGLALFGGLRWLDAAKEQHGWSQAARDAAKLTGGALILAAVSFVVIVATKLTTSG